MKSRSLVKDDQSLAFGGQALIEGVMIRSRKHVVMSVRQPNNEIITHVEKITTLAERHGVFGVPFIRGIVSMFENMYLGLKALFFSANTVLEEDEKFTYKEFAIVVAITLGISSLFIVVPFLITSLLKISGVLFNIVEALIRLSLFILYIASVSMWGDFRRILQYHGAEHKTINAHEANEDLEIEKVEMFSRLHPGCGTSFIFIVVIVSILLFSLITSKGFITRLTYRLLLIPALGSISYELLRLSRRHRDSAIMRLLTMPGLAFQKLTTREPDKDILEVAIKAVEEATRLG